MIHSIDRAARTVVLEGCRQSWRLYHIPGAEAAAQELTDNVQLVVNAFGTGAAARAACAVVLEQYADYGANDSVVHDVLRDVLDYLQSEGL